MKRRKAIKVTGITISSLFVGDFHLKSSHILDTEKFYLEQLPQEYFIDFISLIANRFEQKIALNQILKNVEKEIDTIPILRQYMDSIVFTKERAIRFQKGIIQLNELQRTLDFDMPHRNLKTLDYVKQSYSKDLSLAPAFEVVQIIDKEIIAKTCQLLLG